MYHLIRPLLFILDAEKAHNLSIRLLKSGFIIGPPDADNPVLHTNICGLLFPNPIGLAAGYDKQAEVMGPLFYLGFGSVEVGSITPRPQPGNPQPRLFRVTGAKAIINRFGFNSDGFDECHARLAQYVTKRKHCGILGINIGKNKETVDAASDYVAGVKLFAPLADYLTVNISSPNTPGLRDLQRREVLSELLTAVMKARDEGAKKPPLFIKIAPDLSPTELEDVAAVVLATGVDGVIIGNTTLSRPPEIPEHLAREAGGLSGRPLRDLSTGVLRQFYKITAGKIPLIGCGGIGTGQDAYDKIKAGASLVQFYSALVYEGPGLARRMKKDLVVLLRRDGFVSVAEAVGTASK